MKKTLKKILSLTLCLVLAVCALTTGASAASSQLTFTVDEFGGAVLTSCDAAAEGIVKIASTVTIDGTEYDVKTIGEEAFKDCTQITRITIPEGVTSIDNRAFSGCVSLSTVDVPSTLISCQYDAFEGCNTVTVNCYKSNYQFFAVYGFADNLKINVLDGELSEQDTQSTLNIFEFIRAIILKILAFFGLVK